MIKVVPNAEIVAVSGEIIKLVHVNSGPFIGHYLSN